MISTGLCCIKRLWNITYIASTFVLKTVSSIRSAGGMKSSTAVFVEEFFLPSRPGMFLLDLLHFLLHMCFLLFWKFFMLFFCCVSFHIPLWHDMVSPVFCNLLQELCCSSQGSQVPALNNHHYHHLLHCTTMVKIFKQQRNTWQTYKLFQVLGSLQCLSIASLAPFPSMSIIKYQ